MYCPQVMVLPLRAGAGSQSSLAKLPMRVNVGPGSRPMTLA